MPFAHTGPDRGTVPHQDRTPAREKVPTRAHILVVDDDEGACRALQQLLRADGFSTSAVADGAAALAEAGRALPDAVLTDLEMPRIRGVQLCEHLHEIDPDLPVIVMTAHSGMQSVIESLRAGADDYLIKPLQHDAVLWCIERAIARRNAKVERQHLRQQNDELYRTLAERLVLSSVREQEHAEAEGLQRAQLNALLETLKEGVTIADQGGRLLLVNDAACAITGVGNDDLRTIDAVQSVAVYDIEGRPLRSEERPLMRALSGDQFVDYEVLCARPNGEKRSIVSTGTSVRDENGNVALAIVVFATSPS